MDVLILRHGIAVPRGTLGYPNDDRPLTEEGIEKMEKAARGMLRVMPDVDVILTSPLQRARRTAEIVASAMHRRATVKFCDELLPGSSMDTLVTLLAKYADRESVMIVGHNPELTECISTLLGSQRTILDLKKGSLCSLHVPGLPGTKPGTLQWHMTSKQLRYLATS